MVIKGQNRLSDGHPIIEILGRGDFLSLDARKRFRLPEELSDALRRAYGQAAPHSDLPPDAVNRLPFYFAPGTGKRIFLYPAPNIALATSQFEAPPAGMAPALVRKARDYFYGLLRFAEADRQNRLQLPEPLCRHAAIGDDVDRVCLVCRGAWFVISKVSTEDELMAEREAAFEQCVDELLDAVKPASPGEEEGQPT